MGLLQRSALGVYRRHPWQSLLLFAGLVLSVATVIAIDLSIDSARRGFELSQRSVTGDASHQLLREGGYVEEDRLAWLRIKLGIRPALPVIELAAREPHSGRRLRLLGLDLLGEAELRPWLGATAQGLDLAALWRADPPAVLAPSALGERLGVEPGQRLELRLRGVPAVFELAATFDATAWPGAAEDLLVADIGTVQRVAGLQGKLSRIDLVLDPADAERLRRALPPGLLLVETRARQQQTLDMSRAFTINLRAMSLLALMVGAFLVFQTLRFMVLRRTELIGLWRAIGVRRRELAMLLLREALLIGLLCGLLGSLLGIVLAQLLLERVLATIDDLYFRVTVARVFVTPALLAKGLALSVGSALLAVLLPLRDALKVPALGNLSRSRVEALARRQAHRAWPLGLLLTCLGAAWLGGGLGGLLSAFVAIFAMILGVMLAIPALLSVMLAALTRLGPRLPLLGRLALAQARQGLSRTGVASAVLALAVATVIGMATMIHSFRASVIDWIEASLVADLYLSSPDADGQVPPDLVAVLAALPEVEEISRLRRRPLMHAEGPLVLSAIDLGPRGFAGYRWVAGDADTAWAGLQRGEALASEPLARRLNLAPGAQLVLPTPRGERVLRIAAVYRDYTSSQGLLTIPRELYREWFADDTVAALGLFARSGAVDALRQALSVELDGIDDLVLLEAGDIRAQTLAVFDRTFAITRVIHGLAGMIAFVAVLGALLGLALERQRDELLLASLGLGRAELRVLRLGQALALGLVAALLALPLGLGLSWVLVEVVNQRAFGWTMAYAIAPGELIQALLLAPLAALLAALVADRVQRAPVLAAGLRASRVA